MKEDIGGDDNSYYPEKKLRRLLLKSIRKNIISYYSSAFTINSATKTPKWSVTKQSNAVTSNEKTSNEIKIQEVKKNTEINPSERKNIKMVVIS